MNQRLLNAWLFGFAAALAVLTAVLWFAGRPRVAEQFAQGYAFTIPPLFFSCMEVRIGSNETFGNFEFEQPTVLRIRGHEITLHDISVVSYRWCGYPIQSDTTE